ncbi:MAG: dockerin type I repeat-containing protein, partial [Candidatus Omnitrophota bacterium]
WDWDYRWMQTVSDMPSNEDYASSGNAALILGERTTSQGYDLLTYALNGVGYAATFGKTLFYNWMCAGWSLYPWSANNAAIDRYTGFLKTLYASGMIGANAGYYSYPRGAVSQASFSSVDTVNGAAVLQSLMNQNILILDGEKNAVLKQKGINRPPEMSASAYDQIWYILQLPNGFDAQFDKNQPPHWVQQIEALGYVHAQFSYLEDMLRQGDLLPGEDGHVLNLNRPAYEFRTGYKETRVLARKKQAQKRWLISAWAADGVTRTVEVTIPGFGQVSVVARPAGSLYDARIVNGIFTLTLLDSDPVQTPLTLPASIPDTDGSGDVSGDGKITMYDAALVLKYTVGGTLTPAQQTQADINGDAKVDATDAYSIAQKAVGLK